jgi:hypothetical protein
MKKILKIKFINLFKYFHKKCLVFGFDIKKLTNLKYYTLFKKHKKKWIRQGGLITRDHMILNDFYDNSGQNKSHYFHQDLLVAKYIYENNPRRHIDIGSRIDGFVAHVAAFRKIEVLDVRDLPNTGHPNIKFTKKDLMEDSIEIGLTDSLSCLHAIEYFGMGRYGEQIDINGHKKGLENMVKLIEPNGVFYLSFPIGAKDEVHFNAHRIFHPKSIFSFKNISEKIKLKRFDYVDDNGQLNIDIELKDFPENLEYGCGIYTFTLVS